MPIYEYLCDFCGRRWDAFASVENRDVAHCPTCNYPASRQLAAPAGKVKGQACADGSGGADQFTADVMGFPVHDIPEALRTQPRVPRKPK